MFESFAWPNGGRKISNRSPFPSKDSVWNPANGDDTEEYDGENDQREEDGDVIRDEDGEDVEDANEDENGEDVPLLPIFSSEVLDRLPVYNITHIIRLIVLTRCETTLSWDQLRSPQVSQFLVKPIQQQIRSSHFSRATLYALLANCLQFQKEGQMNSGITGISRTRALICELLAMRLLREFDTRELIDALSYDFDPFQGINPGGVTNSTAKYRAYLRGARISTIEVAIRAQSKRFLAHPLVVQHLEAIWAGNIVFHSAADNLHRKSARQGSSQSTSYGTIQPSQQNKSNVGQRNADDMVRRTATLYDPHEASPFKLSRLRVPRYRQLFSTCSLAIMLGLFVTVLKTHSVDITFTELFFWFWSAGFMLDEIISFTEQGFGLYIVSVWNAFDLGIVLMLLCYYILRLYGILLGVGRRHYIANMAYDVLASTAVLLFPRLFSVLDHYRYFSQLLIAFRMMAMDLFAILLLIVISCSGFLVAFTLSFPVDLDAPSAAYTLFQIVMGFTPAAWDIWNGYNPLGKALLTLFLFICHFLIVTILITVLTNSFMAVVQNANEEHQYLFAVNTISMVKSDALFSYVAPSNIFGWFLSPLRWVMSFRRYVKLNRMLIKITHSPLLIGIFLYERIILSRRAYDPTDLIEQRGRLSTRVPAFSIRGQADLFSPQIRLREPSITTFKKDRALDEVFRRPFNDTTPNARVSKSAQRKESAAVHDWMQRVGQDGGASPPLEQPQSVLDRLESRRPKLRKYRTSHGILPTRRDLSGTSRSATSDPEELSIRKHNRPEAIVEEDDEPDMSIDDVPHQTDADGDDELNTTDDHTNDETDTLIFKHGFKLRDSPHQRTRSTSFAQQNTISESEEEDEGYFRTPMTAMRSSPPVFPSSYSSAKRPRTMNVSPKSASPSNRLDRVTSNISERPTHIRNASTNTIVYSPILPTQPLTTIPLNIPPPKTPKASRPVSPARPKASRPASPARRPAPDGDPGAVNSTNSGFRSAGRRSPKRSGATTPAVRARPIMPPHGLFISGSGTNLRNISSIPGFLGLDMLSRSHDHRPSFSAQALDLASDIGDNRHGPDSAFVGAMPASFSTQMEMAARRQQFGRGSGNRSPDEDMVSRIVMARMNSLEEGFREVLQEVKEWRKEERSKTASVGSSVIDEEAEERRIRRRKTKGERKRAQRSVPLSDADEDIVTEGVKRSSV
ncbi:hypothetical protein M501DRAFT_1057989 [Patellaria atrata CBS 101060]|uniref:Ion transport domain-containing protein n=1 Tax=Patellaria atrata CBS 101060 TaxID=1346257 RepID=A0A9P4S9X1_9PEZI|nr:hypothetical protein M501DRAFT_1057989 [Patellaria atrata CBS 101060]